jgi:hypothetical protein
VRRALRALRSDAPPEQPFGARLHRRLVAAGRPPAASWLGRWREAWERRAALRGALAGALGTAAVFGLLHRAHPDRHALAPVAQRTSAVEKTAAEVPAPVHLIPVDKIAVIRLTFTAEMAVADVMFEVRLPDGLFFWSEGQRVEVRTFQWRGRLTAGDNALPVAVRGERPGRYQVMASAEAEGRRVEHAVLLEVTGA